MTVTALHSLSRQAAASGVLGLPEQVRTMLELGRVVLITSRASGTGGVEARKLAVQGVYVAAAALTDRGLDLAPLLPEVSTLTAAVEAGHIRRTSRTHSGTPLDHYFYVHDAARAHGVVALVQWGSGTKLDDEDRQPALHIVAEQIRTHRPALVFGAESRGWGRHPFEMGTLVSAMKTVERELGCPPYIGHLEMAPARGTDPDTERALFDQGMTGRQEASTTISRTTRGAVAQVVRGLVEGPWRYPCSAVPPPPVALARLRQAAGRPGHQVAFLDTPAARPDPDAVVYGLPQARTADGRLADQVANVRWFYETWLTPGWTTKQTAAHLVRHGYSTQALRRQRGDDGAVFTLRPGASEHRDAWNVCDSIWQHREFHLTGELVQAFGDGSRIPVTVLTPDGSPLAHPQQVQRIEKALAELASVRSRPRSYLLSGQPVLVDGEPSRLVPRVRRDGTVSYVYERVAPRPRQDRHHAGVPLPHDVLVGALLEALAATASGRLVPAASPRGDQDLALEVERLTADLQAQEKHVQDVQARYRKELTRATSELRLQAAGEAVDQAAADLTEVKAALLVARDRLHDQPGGAAGVPLAQLFPLAASLRDPLDQTHRATLRHAIGDFTIRTGREAVMRDTRRHQVDFAFDLTLVEPDGAAWTVPVSGSHITGSSADTHERLMSILASMRDGVPAMEAMPSRAWYPWLLATLGGHRPVVLKIRDPRLLRLTMAVLHPPSKSPAPAFLGRGPGDVTPLVGPPLTPRQRTAAARRLGEPASLLHRIADVHGAAPRPMRAWLLTRRPRLGALVLEAATTRRGLDPADLPRFPPRCLDEFLEQVDGRLRPTPCPHCGSRRRALTRLGVIPGLLCLTCRRDDLGHIWPRRPYDSYLEGSLH